MKRLQGYFVTLVTAPYRRKRHWKRDDGHLDLEITWQCLS